MPKKNDEKIQRGKMFSSFFGIFLAICTWKILEMKGFGEASLNLLKIGIRLVVFGMEGLQKGMMGFHYQC